MNPERFFELLLKELEQTPVLQGYYKFLRGRKSFLFRRNYFLRRLEFIAARVGSSEKSVWDAGCGYGTSAIFLTLSGHSVRGTTMEFYSDLIDKRRAYWSQFGDLGKFTYVHEDLFNSPVPPGSFDRILVQDALHHIEPIDQGIQILSRSLKPDGKIVVVDVNGRAFLIRIPLYMQRGSKRVITMHDEKLNRDYVMGNENVRSFGTWKGIFERNGMKVADYEFIRCYPPFLWSQDNYDRRIVSEKQLWRDHAMLREYGYMGMNLLVDK